jgi:hypothetical protein
MTRNDTMISLAVNSWINGGRIVWPGADLSGANLIGADLRGAYLRGADLSGAVLSGANLRDAVLIDANLIGAVLIDANLSGAGLIDANLRDAVLIDANLSDANLIRAVLIDANLRGAGLRGANLSGAKYREDTLAAGIAAAERMDGYTFHLFRLENGSHKIMAGCRWLKINEYRAHVAAEYPDTDKARETLDILDFLERRAGA